MVTKKWITGFLILSFFLLFQTGCDRSAKERDNALEEARQAKDELVLANAKLKKCREEIDDLNETLAVVSESLDKANHELSVAVQLRDDMQGKADDLAVKLTQTSSDEENTGARIKRVTEDLTREKQQFLDCRDMVKNLLEVNEELESEIKKLEAQLPEEEYEEAEEDVNS